MDVDPDLDSETGLSNRAVRRIRQIAAILGCPVGDFFGVATARPDLKATIELLALWGSLKDDADRAAILCSLREAAAALPGETA